MISFFKKLGQFFYWKCIDIRKFLKNGRGFSEYGLTMFCGRQGGGKTTALVEYLERMRIKYPNCIIVTNFGYINETCPLDSWHDLLTVRNGDKGVVFAIDEIQNEFSTNAWKDFPEGLLGEITQQRKQKIKIVATSQIYTRVVKQLREQCYEVAECRTLAGRWTRVRLYDAEDYNSIVDSNSLEKKFKLPRKKSYSFIQTDDFRCLYDSYKKIERIKKWGFVPKEQSFDIKVINNN